MITVFLSGGPLDVSLSKCASVTRPRMDVEHTLVGRTRLRPWRIDRGAVPNPPLGVAVSRTGSVRGPASNRCRTCRRW